MSAQKKKGMTREQAAELYRDLQKAMASMKGGKSAVAKASSASSGIDTKAIAQSISAAMRRDNLASPESRPVATEPESALPVTRGQYMAIVFVLVFGIARVALSAMEAVGFGQVMPAEASVAMAPKAAMSISATPGLSREEVKILTSLDGRRAELEERSAKLDERQADIERRDREFAARLTQLREINEKLSTERDRDEKKRNTQLEQLANVYGSMNPPEAATLMQQLDPAIALGLLERMPEKRIGQILALMSQERALYLTKMLSARGQ